MPRLCTIASLMDEPSRKRGDRDWPSTWPSDVSTGPVPLEPPVARKALLIKLVAMLAGLYAAWRLLHYLISHHWH